MAEPLRVAITASLQAIVDLTTPVIPDDPAVDAQHLQAELDAYRLLANTTRADVEELLQATNRMIESNSSWHTYIQKLPNTERAAADAAFSAFNAA